MEKDTIKSFETDHTVMTPGIYVSRVDDVNNGKVTTYDIRLFKPNGGEYVLPAAAHTIEHFGAVYFRNHTQLNVVYFGPMGCQTGLYLVIEGEHDAYFIKPYINEWIKYVISQDTIPGVSIKECGNAELHSLNGAKQVLSMFYSYLNN